VVKLILLVELSIVKVYNVFSNLAALWHYSYVRNRELFVHNLLEFHPLLEGISPKLSEVSLNLALLLPGVFLQD
jgi:hypothetical protein